MGFLLPIFGVAVIERVDRPLVVNSSIYLHYSLVVLVFLDGTELYFSLKHIEAAIATFRV